MTSEALKAELKQLQALSAAGREIIAGLKSDITSGPMKEYLAVREETESSLTVSFFGLRLVFRIESCWPAEHHKGRLVVCSQSYDAKPVETPLTLEPQYSFDADGRVFSTGSGSHSKETFSPFFLGDVLAAVEKEKLTLRP